MSQNDVKAERERSVKLCQLVHERQIKAEVGYEIRKLSEEGVLIDFQDQNRNKKTALHLAVEKDDVICVKFLLPFKPSLEVKDEDGKTPVELAELHGCDDILNVLVNNSADVVNESYIEVFDFQSLTRQKIEAIKLRPTFKVLKLMNCPSLNEVWVKLDDQDYVTAFNESSHLFFIAIETKEMNIENDQEVMKKILNVQRPMIIQFSSSESQNAKIYFKDDRNAFVEITEKLRITQAELDVAVQSEDDCNMKLLVAALRSNLFGSFTGDLLDTKLSTNGIQSEAVNRFTKSNALCHRFFKLFDESQPQIDTIVASLSFKGYQSLQALLDLPFELNDEKPKLTEYQQDILSVVDFCGCNLMMMAAEQKNLDAIKLLLRCGCDFNNSDCYNKRASDICWDAKAFDCLAELIEAGSPYPCNFSSDEVDESSEAYERINAMTESINSFHANIEDGEIEEVKRFITSHPHIKHAYDTKNKCALAVALESNQLDIYSLLMSEGFEPGADDEYCTALDESKFKNEIRNSHRTYFKKAFEEPHLMRLLKMYRLSFGSKDRAKCSSIIRRMFDELNEIDEIIPILKICSTSSQLKIVFDFNCNSVVDMDVTKQSKSLGAVYPSDGFIYIGAKNHGKEFYDVIGTLIHELTHYAMKLTYENSCKPYNVDDIANINHFENITTETQKICDENPSTDSIVTTVFECYNEEVWHQELIVRVPELLARYKTNSKALKAAKRNTPELFHVYREKTLKDVTANSEVLLQKYLIGKINNQTGIVRKIENLKVKFENVGDIDFKSVNVITSNAPHLTLTMLHQNDCDNSHIFVTLEQVAIGNILDKIAKVNAKETTLIVDCIGRAQKYQESLRKLLKSMKNIKTIALVMNEAERSAVKENNSKVEFKTYTHKWAELTESSKVHLLDQKVIFQGVEMNLNKLVEPSSGAMNFFPLGELVDCKDFKIGNELQQTSHKFYITRNFIRERQDTKATIVKLKELLQNEPKMSVMIISDEAGSGKSVTLSEIAKNLHSAFSDRWVVFVDLKRHIEALKSVEDCKKIESFEDFISELILKDETDFDRELFKEMFRDGKTFVLFDGFDEISPNFKNLLLHVLRLFKSETGNQLYITTRPHLEADLKRALGDIVFKLEEFSEDCQKRYLVEYWKSVAFKNEKDFEVLSDRLLEKFAGISTSKFIGFPLLMRMKAEMFGDPIQENLLVKVDSLNVASIFKEFVDKYLARWKESGSEISLKENVEIDRDGGILEIHHNIAIKHKLGDKFTIFEVDESNAEKIARVGLIRYDKAKKTFEFIHETFAEYFVADFICFHLKRKNRNPSHDCRQAIKILVKVLYGYDFKAIKTFLGQTLETTNFNLNEASCQSVAKCLSEVVGSQSSFGILSYSLYEETESNNNNIFILLLSILKFADKDFLLQILESEFNGSSLHIAAAYCTTKIVSTLCEFIIATCDENSKEIFKRDTKILPNVLFSAASNKNHGVLTALCESLKPVLPRDEIGIMFQQKNEYRDNIIGYAAERSSDEVFHELISLLPIFLSADELKGFVLVQGCNRDCFQRAFHLRNKEIVETLIVFAKRFFDAETPKLYFCQPGTNIFHLAAQNSNGKIFTTFIESTRDVLSRNDFKFMLMQKDSEGSNVLHNIAERGDEIKFVELNSILREYLSDNEIRTLLLDANGKGQNCFFLVASNLKINFQVFRETIENLLPLDDLTRLLQESFREIDIFHLAAGMNNNTGEGVPTESIKYLLTKKGYNERNAFQYAAAVANDCDVEKWNQLVSFAQTKFSVDEIRAFLLDYITGGESCFHLAVANEAGSKICEAVCDTFKSVFSVDDQKEIAQQKYSDQRNVLHAAVRSSKKLKIVIEYLSEILSREEIKAMLEQKDSDERNILFYLDDSDAVKTLITILLENLSNDEIKSLILDEDCKGQTFLEHYIVSKMKSNHEVIRSLSNFLKRFLNEDERRKFFRSKNRNPYHLAAKTPGKKINNATFLTIHGCLKCMLVFTDNEIKSMIQEKDSNGNNILHLICQHDSAFYPNMLIDALKVVKNVLDADQFREFLASPNNNGSNCLLVAIKGRHSRFLKSFSNFIKNELSIDDQKNLIKKCDSNRNNIFMCAAQNDDTKIFPFVEVFAREILSEVEMREMLLHDENCEGETCVQYVVRSKSVTEIKYLFETIKTILNRDDQRDYFSNKTHNLFRMAVKNKNRKIFSTCHESLKRVFTHSEIKSMIQEKDSNGNNIVHLICQQNTYVFDLAGDTLLDLLKLLKTVFDSNNLKVFLTSSNDHGSNCLLVAVKFKCEEFLDNLFEIIQTELDIDDQRKMFQKHDSDDNDIFMCATLNQDTSIFLLVKGYAKEILTKDQYALLSDKFAIDINNEENSGCETDEVLCHPDAK